MPDPRGYSSFTLLPAVDVKDGLAVRLVQGALGTGSRYGSPIEAALGFAQEGATWLHLVDLDAAFGTGSNAAVLGDVVRALREKVRVEVSGGIRDDVSLAAALAMGSERVVLGTAALEDPDWTARVIGEHGPKIAVSLDVRGATLAARGWTRPGGDLWETLARLDAAGCTRYVVTDVSKDGMMTGPNLTLLADVCAATPAHVIASGGISSLDDLCMLAASRRLEGAVIGRALYDGAFTVTEALASVDGGTASEVHSSP